MPGMIRPNKKAMKIAYRILGTPKDMQQKDEKKAPERLVKEWSVDSYGIR